MVQERWALWCLSPPKIQADAEMFFRAASMLPEAEV